MLKLNRKIEKVYFPIGEVAEMFGVNTSLIRHWEKEFDIIKPFRNKKGNRLFSPKDVDNFHVIFHLVKERGFTLQGAREKLRMNKQDTFDTVEMVKTLQQVKNFLLEIKDNL